MLRASDLLGSFVLCCIGRKGPKLKLSHGSPKRLIIKSIKQSPRGHLTHEAAFCSREMSETQRGDMLKVDLTLRGGACLQASLLPGLGHHLRARPSQELSG